MTLGLWLRLLQGSSKIPIILPSGVFIAAICSRNEKSKCSVYSINTNNFTFPYVWCRMGPSSSAPSSSARDTVWLKSETVKLSSGKWLGSLAFFLCFHMFSWFYSWFGCGLPVDLFDGQWNPRWCIKLNKLSRWSEDCEVKYFSIKGLWLTQIAAKNYDLLQSGGHLYNDWTTMQNAE